MVLHLLESKKNEHCDRISLDKRQILSSLTVLQVTGVKVIRRLLRQGGAALSILNNCASQNVGARRI